MSKLRDVGAVPHASWQYVSQEVATLQQTQPSAAAGLRNTAVQQGDALNKRRREHGRASTSEAAATPSPAADASAAVVSLPMLQCAG